MKRKKRKGREGEGNEKLKGGKGKKEKTSAEHGGTYLQSKHLGDRGRKYHIKFRASLEYIVAQFCSHLSDIVCSYVVHSHFQMFSHWFFSVFRNHFWLPSPDLHTHSSLAINLFITEIRKQ